MSPKPQFIRCSHTTAAGAPCKAWAMHGSDPPACTAHARRDVDPKVSPGQVEGLSRRAGAPPGNQNARTHGFYARTLSEQELDDLVFYAAEMTLDDEIACARIALRRALEFIQQDAETLGREQYLRAAALIFHGTRTIARLLRDRYLLSTEAAEGIADFMNEALDLLSEQLGREL